MKALLVELNENKNTIKFCLDELTERRLFADSLRMQIGPKLTALSIDNRNHLIAKSGSTDKCKVSTDIQRDIQSSGKLNLIRNENIRGSISRWSTLLKELESEENEWAKEFSNQFIPYTNKWIQWDDIDFLYNEGEPGYFKSRFNVDSRLILQEKEFSNIVAIQYWRIARVVYRTDELLEHTNKLSAVIQKEIND